RRGSAASRGYGPKWRRARAEFLRAHPLCRLCRQARRTTGATVVDHIIPHRGDPKLFWSRSNWQALCKDCHDGAKSASERSGGVLRGCDEEGNPLDPAHRWNAGPGVPPEGSAG
ncbi:MAG: HNH endonuclease, partial [Actinomycetota bacterium]|nr:HNH endonuclease [Actinomycetota bacterium]